MFDRVNTLDIPNEVTSRIAPELASQGALTDNILLSALERMPVGLIIYDYKHQMVFCNQAALNLLDLPDYLFAFGPPSLERMLRYNATKGVYGPGDIDAQVKDRMRLVTKREPYRSRLISSNGKCLEFRGTPLDFGGFAATYFEIDLPQVPARTSPDSEQKAIYASALQWPHFHKQCNALLKQARGSAISALHFIDVDDYKGIFQKYGERGAGALMNILVQRIAGVLAATDKLVYLGEDEIAIFQYDVPEASQVTKLETRLAAISSTTLTIEGASVIATFSSGIALAPRDGNDVDSLLLFARNAMNQKRLDPAQQKLSEAQWAPNVPTRVSATSDPHMSDDKVVANVELRQDQRPACFIRCRCSTSKGTFWVCVVDISRTSMGMTIDPTISMIPGSRITIESGPLIGVSATVSWANRGSLGAQFDFMPTTQKQIDGVIAGLL